MWQAADSPGNLAAAGQSAPDTRGPLPGDQSSPGLTCAEQLTCGCHVHVAVSSDEERVAVLDRIRPWLAVLTALTNNSPFWNGADTGYAGYRTQAWNHWPATGPTELFGSAAGRARLCQPPL